MPTKQSLQNFGSGIELLLNRLIAQKALENAQSSAEQSLLPARTAAGEANPSNFVLEPQFQPAAQAIQPDKMAVLMAAMRNVPGNPFLTQQFQQESQMRQAMAPKVEQIDPTKDLTSISPTGQVSTIRPGTPKNTLDQTPTVIEKMVDGKVMTYHRFYDTQDPTRQKHTDVLVGEKPPSAMNQQPQVDINKLTPAEKSLLDKVANYEIDLSRVSSIRGNRREFLTQALTQLHPEYDSRLFGTRSALMKDFTSGNESQNIKAINTVISHLNELKSSGDALQNANVQFWNQAKNYGLTALKGDPRVDIFSTKANAVATELAKVFKGTGIATDDEIKAWKGTLSAIKSPRQIQGVIESALRLMDGRFEAIKSKWEEGMGSGSLVKMPGLNEKSKFILGKLGYSFGGDIPNEGQPKATHRWNPVSGRVEEIQ